MSGMHANEALINRFYEAFAKLDGEAMAACYHPDATFSDPVFQGLKGKECGGMWRMLTGRAADLKVVHSNVKADDARGSAHWDAWYLFSATGNKVHNVIDAEFEFKDGLIFRHTDTFDLWRWAGMALGLKGKVLGWAPPVQNAIRKQARKGLDLFLAKES
ncbi:MAG: nuclear transport factor 2 family protein [Polyangiaceae bacterium]|nr:nuclear transport factor 2 family protein [Polyangiaceae bacterium]